MAAWAGCLFFVGGICGFALSVFMALCSDSRHPRRVADMVGRMASEVLILLMLAVPLILLIVFAPRLGLSFLAGYVLARVVGVFFEVLVSG